MDFQKERFNREGGRLHLLLVSILVVMDFQKEQIFLHVTPVGNIVSILVVMDFQKERMLTATLMQ